jgi:hypothetical protein
LGKWDAYFVSKGFEPNYLADLIKRGGEFPSVEEQLAQVGWHPHEYFRKNGGYDGQATAQTVFMDTEGAENPKAALDYTKHTIFMWSFRESSRFVFERLERRPGSILMPAGGIPYHCPSDRKVTIYDIDENLAEPLKEWPNVTAILGSDGDIFKMVGQYDIVCCMGASFYFKREQIRTMLEKFHACTKAGGEVLLNFILAMDEQGKEEDGSSPFPEGNFKKAVSWAMAVIFGLNNEPKFNACFIGRQELRELCKGLFEVQEIYSGSLHIHAVAVLKKI